MNEVYTKYFEDSGIAVVAMDGMGVEFQSVSEVPPATIASFIKKVFVEHGGAVRFTFWARRWKRFL